MMLILVPCMQLHASAGIACDDIYESMLGNLR